MRRFIRDNFLRLTKGDFLSFLEEHEDEFLQIFREEISSLDRRLPEEQLFIDIRMAPLGEELLRSSWLLSSVSCENINN